MRRTISGWIKDAEEVLELEDILFDDVKEVAESALQALREVTKTHGRIVYCTLEYCQHCQDMWPCDTVRRIAKALEVRA